MSDLVFTRINVTLDSDVHAIFKDEVGEGNVSEAFRVIEEELVFGPDEERRMSIRTRARLVAERARKKLLEQRKIIEQQEILSEIREREARERAELIQKITISQVRKLNFKATHLPEGDDHHFTSESLRNRLVDEISHECKLDLQWTDVDAAVRQAVQE